VKIREKRLTILQIRSEFRDNGPGTQSLEIAREMKRRGHIQFCVQRRSSCRRNKKRIQHIDIPTLAVNKRDLISTIKNIIKIRKILRKKI